MTKEEQPIDIIKEILHTPIGTIIGYDTEILYNLHEEIVARFEEAKKVKDWLENAISLKYEEEILAKRLAMMKDTGVVHLQDGNFKITSDVKKKVEWNQSKLEEIILDLKKDGLSTDNFVTTHYNILEKNFENWSLSLKEKFAPARTIKHSKPNYKLAKLEGIS